MINNDEITLNSLEHYVFCPYQWWLIYVENEWRENTLTTMGNILHSKVDNANFIEKRGNLHIERSVPLYSDKINLYGIADVIEFIYNGEVLEELHIVEYKNGGPDNIKEIQKHDGIQLYAQMLCAREIFNCKVSGYIYYNKIRKRIKLNNETFYNTFLDKILKEMREYMHSQHIPKKNKGEYCKSCSMHEICLPKLGE